MTSTIGVVGGMGNEAMADLAANLDALGFELLKRIEDDRGDGIDTVYYGIAV